MHWFWSNCLNYCKTVVYTTYFEQSGAFLFNGNVTDRWVDAPECFTDRWIIDGKWPTQPVNIIKRAMVKG